MTLGKEHALQAIRYLNLTLVELPIIEAQMVLVVDPPHEAAVLDVLAALEVTQAKLNSDEALVKADVLQWSPEVRIRVQMEAFDRLRLQLANLLGLSWKPPAPPPPWQSRLNTTQSVANQIIP